MKRITYAFALAALAAVSGYAGAQLGSVPIKSGMDPLTWGSEVAVARAEGGLDNQLRQVQAFNLIPGNKKYLDVVTRHAFSNLEAGRGTSDTELLITLAYQNQRIIELLEAQKSTAPQNKKSAVGSR